MLTLFYKEQEVRTSGTSSAPEWVARDLAGGLGISQSNLSHRMGRMPEEWKGMTLIHTPGGPQEMATVKEPGLYALIFESTNPEAREFQRWVFETVLPQIRKTGTYTINPDPHADFWVLVDAAIERGIKPDLAAKAFTAYSKHKPATKAKSEADPEAIFNKLSQRLLERYKGKTVGWRDLRPMLPRDKNKNQANKHEVIAFLERCHAAGIGTLDGDRFKVGQSPQPVQPVEATTQDLLDELWTIAQSLSPADLDP